MSHPIYINPDEEIISVIARLRETAERDITFVFPKRSVVTQSAINLKLLAREAEKQQKNVTIVSQNENTLALAQKIGMTTLPYTSDMRETSEKIDVPETREPFSQKPPEPVEESQPRPAVRNIGSSSFLVTEAIHPDPLPAPSMAEAPLPPQAPVPEPRVQKPPIDAASSQNIRIRDMSPEVGPGLNSVQIPKPLLRPDPLLTPPAPQPFTAPLAPAPAVLPASTNSSLRDFYTRTERPQTAAPLPAPKPPKASKPPLRVEKKALSYGLWIFGIGIVGAALAVVFFLVFPKASVAVTPYQITDSIDKSLTVSTDGQGDVPLTKLPQEITVTIPGIANGAPATPSSASGEKASGTIKITSTYSQDQPLIATTRFQAENGKIYRIQGDITVPANGSIETKLVADGTGESYNADHTTFTVPGLKGTDKSNAITAETTSALSGGSGDESSSANTFIKSDIDTLHSQAETKAREDFTAKVNNNDSAYTFTDTVPAELKSEQGLPAVGSTPGQYEYTATFALTPYTLSKDDIINQLKGDIRSDYDGITFKQIASKLDFLSFSLNDDKTQATIKVHLDVVLGSDINESTLKDDLAGKSESGISKLLEGHPEIQKIAITFHPKWALQRIPRAKGKIEINILYDPSLSK